jgi:dihydrodipicolinate synthase/N-acetylneuraminate lyase
LLTPLSGADQLDVPGLERLVEHVLAGGVHGLFILGTTGEGPGLSYDVRHELVERVCRQASGRVPVLVGITDTVFAETLRLAEHAEDAGAQAVVLSSPYYFPLGQADLRCYVESVATQAPLPVFLYNIPSHTKTVFELDTLRAALEMPNVIGLKDSGGNMQYFHQARVLAADRPDWSVLIGPEELLADALLMGGHGGVSGGANLAPRLYVDLYEAAERGDVPQARALQERVWEISRNLYALGAQHGSWLKGLKCALACLDICDDYLCAPFRRFEGPERETVQERLVQMGLLGNSHRQKPMSAAAGNPLAKPHAAP